MSRFQIKVRFNISVRRRIKAAPIPRAQASWHFLRPAQSKVNGPGLIGCAS